MAFERESLIRQRLSDESSAKSDQVGILQVFYLSSICYFHPQDILVEETFSTYD